MALPCNNLGLNQVNSLYGIYQFQQITLNDYYVRVTNQQWSYGQYSDMFGLRGRDAWGGFSGSCQNIHIWGDGGHCGCGDPWSGCCNEYEIQYVLCSSLGGGWQTASGSDWESWGTPEGDVCAQDCGSYWTAKGWASCPQGSCGGGC